MKKFILFLACYSFFSHAARAQRFTSAFKGLEIYIDTIYSNHLSAHSSITNSICANNCLLGTGCVAVVNKLIVKKNGFASWADYVFANSYKFTPINSLETFSKTYSQPPNIVSGEDFENSGVDVSTTELAC